MISLDADLLPGTRCAFHLDTFSFLAATTHVAEYTELAHLAIESVSNPHLHFQFFSRVRCRVNEITLR